MLQCDGNLIKFKSVVSKTKSDSAITDGGVFCDFLYLAK